MMLNKLQINFENFGHFLNNFEKKITNFLFQIIVA